MRGSIPSTVSRSLAEARKRSLDLYRDALRMVPFLVVTYNLPYTVEQCRNRIHDDFRRYRAVDDVLAIDRLLFGARTELEEAQLVYKQRPHVMDYFAECDRAADAAARAGRDGAHAHAALEAPL